MRFFERDVAGALGPWGRPLFAVAHRLAVVPATAASLGERGRPGGTWGQRPGGNAETGSKRRRKWNRCRRNCKCGCGPRGAACFPAPACLSLRVGRGGRRCFPRAGSSRPPQCRLSPSGWCCRFSGFALSSPRVLARSPHPVTAPAGLCRSGARLAKAWLDTQPEGEIHVVRCAHDATGKKPVFPVKNRRS